jgi:hypothetical protein
VTHCGEPGASVLSFRHFAGGIPVPALKNFENTEMVA